MIKASLVVSCVLLLATRATRAGEVQHELLVFGSAEVTDTPGFDEEATGIDKFKVSADVLFSLQYHSFKALGEYLVTNHEADLERLQLGWEPSEHSILWLGRFHEPASNWNHVHHHGQFLQTSVTRPAAEEWEDEDGIIPQHFLGALWEASWDAGGSSRIQTAFGAGLAPVMTPKGMVPFDLVQPDARDHKLGIQARVAWQPHEFEDTGIGLIFASNDIATRDAPVTALGSFDQIDQTVAGLYARGDWNPWKVEIAAYHVSTRFEGLAIAPHQAFQVGYAQVERDLSNGLEIYARHENTHDATDNLYLQMFPRYVLRRSTLGGRWQFARTHALTLEMSSSASRIEIYHEIRLQWSATLL
jgi:hypothetical protein